MRHYINPVLVYISAFTTGLLLTYIALVPPTNPIPLIVGTVLCAVPMVRAIVLTAMRKYGYPY
jgi:hypothetical protein